MKRNNPSQNEHICGENNSESSETWKKQHTLAKLMEDDPWISSVELASHMASPGSVPLNMLSGDELSSVTDPPSYTMSVYEYMNSFHPLGLQGALKSSTCPPKILEKIVQQRCRDFEENGVCIRGDTRPMVHGVNPIVVEDLQSSSKFNPLGSFSALPSIGTSSSTNAVRSEGISSAKVVSKNKSEIEGRFVYTPCLSHSDPNKTKQVLEDVTTQPKIEKPTQMVSRTIFVHSKSRKDNKIEVLVPHFQKFGEVIDIRVPRGGHRSFIQFSKREEAERALEAPDAAMGNRFKIQWSNQDNIPVDILSIEC